MAPPSLDARLLKGACFTRSKHTQTIGDEYASATLVGYIASHCFCHGLRSCHVLERLPEVLLMEALRSGMDSVGGSGLVRGLGDERLAAALRALHARPQHAWTVEEPPCRSTTMGDPCGSPVMTEARLAAWLRMLPGMWLALKLGLMVALLSRLLVFGVHLPLSKTLVQITFLAGLLSVVGNIISKTIITIVACRCRSTWRWRRCCT